MLDYIQVLTYSKMKVPPSLPITAKKTEYSSDYQSTLQSRHVSRGVTVSRTINFNVVILLEASLQVSSSTLIRKVLPEEL